jgi:hypothetical protein
MADGWGSERQELCKSNTFWCCPTYLHAHLEKGISLVVAAVLARVDTDALLAL